ncbi:PRTRC genetic system protein E [Mucilaginibacter yixingensis]|uniref:PRTRC genetic system protein E n=1 Tax=Mucilaginibacter yixingensis TaxID=1295612 RepID=A0A2T5J4B0_9SPHI|nr:hypothetical protein [Mucilaginibacter yixingensis]PTQ91835.1 PRTRC genetic system protein E [Mucilaginibacter yixingensis]
MTTNFFQNIASLNTPGNWKIGIRVSENGEIHFIGSFNSLNATQQAGKNIPPFTLKATAVEMDKLFFDKITEPVKETASFQDNLKQYQKALDKAKTQTKPVPAKTISAGDEQPDQDFADLKAEKKKAYEQAIKTINELSASCKYQEALEVLPVVDDYPDKEKELKSLKADLHRMNEQLKQYSLL